jgi:hypothetical protein
MVDAFADGSVVLHITLDHATSEGRTRRRPREVDEETFNRVLRV